MPVRVMLQEALEYDKQLKVIKRKNRKLEITNPKMDSGEFLSQVRKSDRLNPIITLVVYWGSEKWERADSLHNIIDFGEDKELAEQLKSMIPEYPLHILNLSECQDYEGFQTELKLLFELYARRNDKQELRKYLENHEECKRIDEETIWTLGQLANIKQLEAYKGKEKEDVDMCKAIDEWLADEREEGLKQGREQGSIAGRLNLLYELVRDNVISVKDAAVRASMTETVFADKMKAAGY